MKEFIESIGTIIAALAAIALFIALAIGLGYVLGWIFAVLWNASIAFVTPLPEISAWQGLAFLAMLNIIASVLTREKKA